MDDDECRRRFARAEHAYLATVGPDGAPHIVPVVHDLTGDEIVVVVDHKPKRTQQLRRLTNIRAHPEVTFLVDHWSTDWDRLWWVRADAVAEVVDDGPRRTEGVTRLQRRYAQYREHEPTGPLIVARVRRWTGWAATEVR